MMRRRESQFNRRGLTLVEVLVVISVIGVLIGLAIPAVQMARQAARRSTCANNLRQFGLALNSYATAFGTFPMGHGSRGYSPHAAILPYVEQRPLFDSINFQTDSEMFPTPINSTASNTALAVFLCPSDVPPAFDGTRAFTNYAGNHSVGVQKFGYNGIFSEEGAAPISPAGVTDGLSHTAAFSEWLLGPGDHMTRDAKRSVFATPRQMAKSDQLGAFADQCHDIDISTALVNVPTRGYNWLVGEFNFTLYNHTLPPNDHSCTNGNRYQLGAWTAGSNHPSGANLVYADGHVKFMSDAVNRQVWWALGSRNGNEAVSDGP